MENVMPEKEYVYVLSNPSFDNNIFKIGWSRKHPTIRANNLYTTGVPTPFIIEFVISTDNGIKLETNIHNHLKQYRINEKREFFKISKEQIYTIIKNDLKLELINNNLDFEYEIKNKNVDTLEQKNKTNFKCEKCNYITKNRFDYNKHYRTIKHINNLSSISKDNFHIKNNCQSEKQNFVCGNCDKIYKDNSGLWKHKKKCIQGQILNNECNLNKINAEFINNILERNKILSNMIVEQNKKIVELSKTENIG